MKRRVPYEVGIAIAVILSVFSLAQATGTASGDAALALQSKVVAVYQAASPSVVNVTGMTYVQDLFFGDVAQEGTGSGFVYDTLGHIVTNYHVVQGTDELIVTLPSGGEYSAQIVGLDEGNDLAVLQIDAGDALPPALALADSDALQVGQFVLAIGTPFGLDQTLTTGVVSALGRVIQSPDAEQFIGEVIQTDAAINPGNSGGPLLNLDGEVIGVNSQLLSTSGSSAGIGFAISANTVKRVVPELIANGRFSHPWIGVSSVDVSTYTAAIYERAGYPLPVTSGVLVVGFDTGSPAKAAGVRGPSCMLRYGWYQIPVGGDIIVAINGVPTETMEDLLVYLEGDVSIGDTVRLTVVRDGAQLTIPVTVGERPAGT